MEHLRTVTTADHFPSLRTDSRTFHFNFKNYPWCWTKAANLSCFYHL